MEFEHTFAQSAGLRCTIAMRRDYADFPPEALNLSFADEAGILKIVHVSRCTKILTEYHSDCV